MFAMRDMNTNEVGYVVNTFESIKHIDEYGNEFWYAHELSKALGYSQYHYFKPVIENAKIQMSNITHGQINLNDHFLVDQEPIISGKGGVQHVQGYRLSRYACYSITVNADPSKYQVAVAKAYFINTTRKVELITQQVNDNIRLANRSALTMLHQQQAAAALEHGVQQNQLGLMFDSGNQGFYNMSTKEVKQYQHIPQNRPVADFMTNGVMAHKMVAEDNTIADIDNKNLQGIDECSQAAYYRNRQMRDIYIDAHGHGPEEDTAEDIKKIERRAKMISKKMMKELEM